MQQQFNGQGIASTVLAAAANGVEDLIQKYRGDVDCIFHNAKLETSEIENPYNELSLKQYCGLFEEAASQIGNENFGLLFGSDFEPRRLGPIGYLMVNSPTMSCALRNLVHYFPAHQDKTMLALSRDQDTMCLSYQITDPRIPYRRQDAELSLGMFCNVFKHCLGPRWTPLEIHFEHSGPCGSSEHERRFGAHVFFGQRTNSIVFRRCDCDKLMPNADPYLFAVVEPLLAERRQMRGHPENFVETIRSHIRLRLGSTDISLPKVAENFGISPGALQRRLKDQSVSFQGLVRAAREELALRYVGSSDMSFTELALALGYSEQSAFSRAFRQWTGLSPRRYRCVAMRGTRERR